MKIKKLDHSFYLENTHLIQALDFTGSWDAEKTRGYGVVLIKVTDELTFAIPLRSRIKHGASYITERSAVQGERGKGLDFSKAVLIAKPSYVSSSNFKIPPTHHNRLKGKEKYITNSFQKYVHGYIKAVKAKDTNILSSTDYRYTTLQNYHAELGLA